MAALSDEQLADVGMKPAHGIKLRRGAAKWRAEADVKASPSERRAATSVQAVVRGKASRKAMPPAAPVAAAAPGSAAAGGSAAGHRLILLAALYALACCAAWLFANGRLGEVRQYY